MKVGLHQMNVHVIRWAPQGFADVIAAEGADKDPETSNNGFNYQFGRW